jgi:hypothetical protein
MKKCNKVLKLKDQIESKKQLRKKINENKKEAQVRRASLARLGLRKLVRVGLIAYAQELSFFFLFKGLDKLSHAPNLF